MQKAIDYREITQHMSAACLIAWALDEFGLTHIALASSFSAEDQVLTNMLVSENPRARLFTLDTGRHFQETYDVWHESTKHFNISYEVAFPDPEDVGRLTRKNGPNLFYDNVESRKSCCAVRKTRPLQKILSTVDAWIVGLRSEQSVTRTDLSPVEWDDVNKIYRISPLCNWKEADVFSYVREKSLPVSVLYEKGFRSIGCAPCTRAIGPDDDVRAGRWWWEEPEHKECGLHNRPKNINTNIGKD